MNSKFRQLLVVLICLLASLACIQSGGGVAPAKPVLPNPPGTPQTAIHTVVLLSATPAASSTPIAPTLDPGASIVPPILTEPGLWVIVREPRYGFGLAAPCWWRVTPMPDTGYNGALTLRSYDEAFFQAHSTKGEWTGGVWPDGAVKVDLTVWEGFDPELSTLEAYKTSFDPSMAEIVQWQERPLGDKTALWVEMRNLVNPADPNIPLYLFRLAPDKLLFISALPVLAIESSDVLAILNSLALTPDGEVRLPQIMPSPAIIPLPKTCPDYVP